MRCTTWPFSSTGSVSTVLLTRFASGAPDGVVSTVCDWGLASGSPARAAADFAGTGRPRVASPPADHTA